ALSTLVRTNAWATLTRRFTNGLPQTRRVLPANPGKFMATPATIPGRWKSKSNTCSPEFRSACPLLAGRLREGNTGNPVVVARLRIEGAATAERSDTGAALCTPRTRDEKLRHCSRVLTNDPDQPAAGEQRQRILHGTTREAGRNG